MGDTNSSTGLRALISRGALIHGVQQLLGAGSTLFDLRRDAWGHGLTTVAPLLAEAGAHHVLVDPGNSGSAVRSVGLVPTTDGIPDADPAVLWGFPHETDHGGRLPVMRACGRVLSTKSVRKGAGVSYGYHYRAPTDTRLALVSGGYAQGLVRSLGGKVSVDIGGHSYPIVGRVAMDACVIDIADGPVQLGDDVTFFGGEGSSSSRLADWSRVTGMTMAELACIVGERSTREVVK